MESLSDFSKIEGPYIRKVYINAMRSMAPGALMDELIDYDYNRNLIKLLAVRWEDESKLF